MSYLMLNMREHLCYSIMTVECISSYNLVNTKHDDESDPTCTIESAPPKKSSSI